MSSVGAAQQVSGQVGTLVILPVRSCPKGNSEITHTHTRSQGQTLILRDAKSIFKEGEHFLDYSGVCLPAPGQNRLFVAE